MIGIRRQRRPHTRRLEHNTAILQRPKVPVITRVARQEAERVAHLMRDHAEEIKATECGGRRIAEFRIVVRRRVHKPATAIGVPIENNPAF